MTLQEDRRETDSGIEVKPVYTEADVAGLQLEFPGEFPFTRGPYKDMYRGRPWRRTSASAISSSGDRPDSRLPSTCPPSSATTPTTREQSARLAGRESRSTRSPTWRSSSTGFHS